MATNSSIGMIQPNGSVIAVYCHYDGYLSGVGKKLINYYRDPAKVKELITLGRNGISSLGKEIGKKQNFYNPTDPDWCLFYGRDRGDRNREFRVPYSSAEDFRRNYDQNYGYLFDPESNIWFAFDGRELTYIPGQSKNLVNAMWKKLTNGTTTESKQFSLAQTAKKILKEFH